MLKPIWSGDLARLRICERAHAGLIRARALQYQQGEHIFKNREVPKLFWWAEGHEALEQDWAAGDFSTWIEQKIHVKAFGVTFAREDIEKLVPSQNSPKTESLVHHAEDENIIKKLVRLVPAAAQSYTQALHDLQDAKRVSFRGPAFELREALRETLDNLAPDDEVMAVLGYSQEGKSGPTMRQKVRFIMKKKGKQSSSEAPEQAVIAFEEAIAKLTRAVYERSSGAAHAGGEREKVAQIRRYVVAIFHDIL
jgi:hypothetical protein